MKKIVIILILCITGFSQAQDKGIIEGIVLDKQLMNEPLAFATITLKKTTINTSTNIDGAYALEVQPGIYTLVFNFPGYEKVEIGNIMVKADNITSIKNIALAARELAFSEIAVTPKKEK